MVHAIIHFYKPMLIMFIHTHSSKNARAPTANLLLILRPRCRSQDPKTAESGGIPFVCAVFVIWRHLGRPSVATWEQARV